MTKLENAWAQLKSHPADAKCNHMFINSIEFRHDGVEWVVV